MAYNLARNSRVFLTTNLSTASGQNVAAGGTSTGPYQILSTGFSLTNTFEIQVLDGFKFSQNVNSQNVQINEGGSTPVRGTRAFNTALNPVDITFSTYIRPRQNTNATAEERVLWNALFGSVAIDGLGSTAITASAGTATTATRASTTSPTITVAGVTLSASPVAGTIYNFKGITAAGAMEWVGPMKVTSYTSNTLIGELLTAPATTATTASPAFTATALKLDPAAWTEAVGGTGTASCALVSTAMSNKNQLQAFGMIFYVDGQWYGVDNCALDSAQVDFGLDAIATIAWSAKGTKLNLIDMSGVTGSTIATGGNVLGTGGTGGMQGTATAKVTTANYITNKLSTTTVKLNVGGGDGGVATTSYAVPITGGSIQFQNNITYVTPANIGTLNQPIGYFTGSRAVSGSINAYLKAGAGVGSENTGDLLNKILTVSQTSTETKFSLQIEMGGASNGTRVEFEIPGAMLGIPTVDIADVVSTSISFSAQSYDPTLSNNSYDIERTNDAIIRYYSV